MDARSVIIRPIVTEKTTAARELANQYVFRVQAAATKHQITAAIEEIFDVSVIKVRTIKMDGKRKRLGRNIGRRSSWKKAMVTLAEGQTIDFFEGV